MEILRALVCCGWHWGLSILVGPFLSQISRTSSPWLVALVASRLVALITFRRLAKSCLGQQGVLSSSPRYSQSIARRLLTFGSWITVSSVVSPLLVQADRFLIGAALSAAAVTAYVLPYEVVVQSLIVVGAISSVAFPSLSRLIHEQPNGWQPVLSPLALDCCRHHVPCVRGACVAASHSVAPAD